MDSDGIPQITKAEAKLEEIVIVVEEEEKEEKEEEKVDKVEEDDKTTDAEKKDTKEEDGDDTKDAADDTGDKKADDTKEDDTKDKKEEDKEEEKQEEEKKQEDDKKEDDKKEDDKKDDKKDEDKKDDDKKDDDKKDAASTEDDAAKPKTKKRIHRVQLKVVPVVSAAQSTRRMTGKDAKVASKRLRDMEAADELRQKRDAEKNSLESFVFELRGQVRDNEDELAKVSPVSFTCGNVKTCELLWFVKSKQPPLTKFVSFSCTTFTISPPSPLQRRTTNVKRSWKIWKPWKNGCTRTVKTEVPMLRCQCTKTKEKK